MKRKKKKLIRFKNFSNGLIYVSPFFYRINMKIILQKVKSASVKVDSKRVGQIEQGYVLLLGITHTDTQKEANWLVEKILKLRLFAEIGSNTFMEKNILEALRSILVVSQFTLYGDCRKGTRPSFTDAARPEVAEPLYEYFVEELKKKGVQVQTGIFGAHMDVELTNDGPITLILEA